MSRPVKKNKKELGDDLFSDAKRVNVERASSLSSKSPSTIKADEKCTSRGSADGGNSPSVGGSEYSTVCSVFDNDVDSTTKASDTLYSTATLRHPDCLKFQNNFPRPLQSPKKKPPGYPHIINMRTFDKNTDKTYISVANAVVTFSTSGNRMLWAYLWTLTSADFGSGVSQHPQIGTFELNDADATFPYVDYLAVMVTH